MPLVRFKIRNELSLGGPELNRSAAVENEEPKAILDTLEVAGLIGILRQLGDLAEFSAEVFNGIQEEVTATASRCQKLTSRVRRIESALSPLEKAVLSQTSHIHFAYTAGSEWHPRIRNGHSHFVQSDLPLCVMESYEQCRDPPPLHLLDRFAVGGPGSCLRKYSDPTFFRKDLSNPNTADEVKVQKDPAHCKRKKKRLPQRNICRSNAVSTSDETNGAHLSSLTDDRQTTSQSTSTIEMPRSSNLQDLSDVIDQSHLQGQPDAQEQSEAQVQSDFQESSKARDSITGSGYIEYVINQSPVDKPEVKLVEGFLSESLEPPDRIGSVVSKGCPSEDVQEACTSIVCDEKKETLESVVEKSSKDKKVSDIHEAKFGPGTPDRVRQNQRDFGRTYNFFDEVDIVGEKQSKSLGNSIDGTLGIKNEEENTSEQGSDTDEFVDARNTIESESESELDGTEKPKLEHYFGDISTYCSEDAISDNNDDSEDIPYEQMAHDPHNDISLNKYTSSGSYLPEDANVSCYLSDPVYGKTLSQDEAFQKPRGFFPMRPYLLAEEALPEVMALEEESVATLAEDCANENIACEEPISSCPSLIVATPAGNVLSEEHLVNYLSFGEAEPHEKILLGQSVANNPSFVEIVTQEEILPKTYLSCQSLAEAVPDQTTWAEEPDSVNPSFPKDVQENKVSSKVLDPNKYAQEANSQEQILLEEFIGIYPCLTEAISDGRFLTGKSKEPAITSLSLTKTMPTEEFLPEKTLEVYHYLAEFPKDKILLENSVNSTHSSCAKAPSEANLSPEVSDSTKLSVADSVPQEQISPEECVGTEPCLVEAVTDERLLPEEPVTTYLSLTEAVTIKKVLPEDLLESYPSLTELPEERILQEETDDAIHPSEAGSDEEISEEVFASANLSVEPHEYMSLKEYVVINPCVAEAVPDENFLPEEPVTTCLTLENVAAMEGVLPEEPVTTCLTNDATRPLSEAVSDKQISSVILDSRNLSVAEAEDTYHSLGDSEENILHEETNDATPPLSEVVTDKQISSEILDSKNLSVAEAEDTYHSLGDSEERILHEETNDAIHLSLSEAVSDKHISSELLDSKYLSVAEAEDTYHSLGDSEEKIVDEETNDATPPFSEVVSDKQISSEILDSKNLYVAEAEDTYHSLGDSEEKILHEETSDAIHPSLSEAVSDKHFSSEILDSKNLYVAEAEDTYHSLGDSEEKILHEETSDAIHPSLSEAVSDKHFSSELLDSKYLSEAEAALQENFSLEELNGIDSCLAEAVRDKKVLPDEPVTTCMSLTKVVPIEEVLPEEPSEALEILPKDKISQDNSDGATQPSCAQGESDETISPGILDSTSLSVSGEQITLEEFVGIDMCLAEAIPHEQITLEEFVGMDSCLEEAFSDKRDLPEEPVTTCLSLEKDAPSKTIGLEPLDVYPSLKLLTEEKISQAEESEHQFLSEGVNDEIISPLETPGFTYRSLDESVLFENTMHGELVGTNPFLELAVPKERRFTDEPHMTHHLLAETVSEENSLPEEPLPTTYQSLAEVIPDEIISLEETNATCIPSVEVVFNEKIPGSEAPDSTTETGLHDKTLSEEPVAMDLSLPEAVSDEKIPGSNVPGSTTETVPHNKTFREEPVAMDLSLPEAVFDEKIPDSNAAGSTTETGPYNKTSTEDSIAMDLSSTKAVFDEKIPGSEAPSFTTETSPHNKTFPEEPVPNNNILPKEPVATYMALAEGIPDQKVFLDDAALLLFAEAIFDQKFSPEVLDTTSPLKEPEMPASPPSLVTENPSENVVVNEGEAYGEHYTGSDVSMNQNCGFSKPKSAYRTIPLSGGTVTVSPGTQESLSNGTSVEPVSIWSNGGLLGLAPLKPPVFDEPNSVSTHIQNEINEISISSTRKQKSSSQLIENSEKSSLPLVVSDPTSQQHSSILSPAHLQSTATSFKVFGFSHRLLMAGFRGNSSSTCKFESIPTSSYDTRVAAIEDKTQHTHGGSSFEEQLDYESCLLNSPTSSPRVEHMKISFNPMDASPVANLKLRIPCQPQYNGESVDMFPSFQLVPDANNSDDDDNSNTFCQSSPCVSVNSLSDSELWESDESPGKSVSSLKQVEERSTHADIGSFSGCFLDLPCYDTVYHQSTSSRVEQDQEQKEEQCPEYKPSVSEIIRDWPPKQPKNNTSNKANTNAVLEKTQNQSLGLLATDDEGER